MFDAGQLVFTIKAAGAQVFRQELQQADQAIEKTGKSAAAAKPQLEAQGAATDKAGKSAHDAKAPLEAQATATQRTGDESKKAAPKQEEQARASERQAETAKKLSVALLAAGVAVGALVGLSVAKYAEFDQAMSNVAAATMATAQEQEALADAALEAGADTAYSAREAAAAEEELAKAGLSTSSIVKGALAGSLALAAAGQLEVARSAEIMATTLKQFKLPASDAAHVSDLLAAGAGKAQGSVDDLSQALQYVGPVAAGLGISLEETTGVLALFASQGQLGERAGTGLRGVIQSLVSPSQLATKELEKYNIEIFDGNGKMKSLAAVSQELKTAFGGLTEAERSNSLGRIFGNEQITAARVLYEGGAKAVEEWTEAVNDSGYAAEQAALRQDNLAGDIEKLGGAFDSALIKTGSGANDVLREMTQAVTALIDGYGELPDGVQTTALVLGVATTAMLLFSGAALGAIGHFVELKKTLELANISMGKTALIAGGVGIALTGVLVVVAGLAQRQAEARAVAESYADALKQGGDAAKEAAHDIAIAQLQADPDFWDRLFGSTAEVESAFDSAKKLGLELDTVTEAWLGNEKAAKKVTDQIARFRDGGEAAQKRAEALGVGLGDVTNAAANLDLALERGNATVAAGEELMRQQAEATEESAGSSRNAADAYLEAASGADQLTSDLDKLIDKINEANGVGQDAISANLDYKNALAEVDDVIAKATAGLDENKDGIADYILTLDESTQAGRDNKAMLVDLAQQSQEAADKQFALDGNTAAYKQTLDDGRAALIKRAEDLGLNADEAGALADQIYRIPSATEWEAIVQTRAAQEALDRFVFTNDGRVLTLNVDLAPGRRATVGSASGDFGFGANGGYAEMYASGGVREHHVAQFARAGAMRIWAEPETGGEAYIPLAAAKRGRSLAVLADVADRFGFDLRPRGAGSFADGGVSTTDARSWGGDIHLQVIAKEGDPIEQQLYRAENELRFFMKTGVGGTP